VVYSIAGAVPEDKKTDESAVVTKATNMNSQNEYVETGLNWKHDGGTRDQNHRQQNTENQAENELQNDSLLPNRIVIGSDSSKIDNLKFSLTQITQV